MKLTHKQPGRLQKTDVLVVFSAEGEKAALPDGVKVAASFLRGFEGKARATRTTFATAGAADRVLVVGLGPKADVDTEGLRRAGAIASKNAEAAGDARATLSVDDRLAKRADGPQSVAQALSEGALMGTYRYVGGKSDAPAAKLKAIAVVGSGADFKRGVTRGKHLAEANMFTRELQDRPGNEITPRALAQTARALARKGSKLTCKVLDEPAMAKLGMGLLLGVSAGSEEPARLIHLTYKPKGRAKGKVALVGKGLTFDAGGISLKPSGKMEDMRYDMSGGAAVLGVFHALANLDVPWEVHGIVPSSENLPDGKATKPGDIHTGMNGTTVEVLNTDAEGRLILADALTYTETKVKPDTIIDLATLTGAVIVGLGHELSGMFPSTDALRDALSAAGEVVGERVWPLPLLSEHETFMKGVVADLRNIATPAMGAGSSSGAAFLRSFVDRDTEWCHLDIAGTAWGGLARDWVGGATGSGVGTRLLIQYLETRK